MQSLKYISYTIACQEVPNEVSLLINISGCPHHCEGCHSKYLWEYRGNYLLEDIEKIMNLYDGLFTCVCFMGGDQNLAELNECLSYVKSLSLKTCVYSGLEDKNFFNNSMDNLDYLKIGRYYKSLGGLNSKTTNQKFYDIKNDNELFLYED